MVKRKEVFMEKYETKEQDSFINNSPLAIVITNKDGVIIEVNSMTEEMFGYKAIEMLGRSIECLMPEDLRKKHRKHRASYDAQPHKRPMGIGLDLIGSRKNGETFPIEIGLSYSEDDDGIRVTSYISDITGRKQVEQDRLNQVEQEKESLERELKMAHQVQVSLLPKDIPDIPGLSLSVKWLPAREVAGDFYDIIPRKNGELDLVIADVTGKGMPAALFMAFTCTTLRASLESESSLKEALIRTNQKICQESNQGLYVTLFIARINTKTGQISFINAGHNPPLHYSFQKDQLSGLTNTGRALGIEPQANFEQDVIQLDPNDFIIFYTDGVTEAIDTKGKDFSRKNLHNVVLEHRLSTPEEMVTGITKTLTDFVAPNHLLDDTTIMVAKREGS
jgi:PAS domain S-box-containing protein